MKEIFAEQSVLDALVDSGLFYPKQSKTAEARLRYYSTHFPLVKVRYPGAKLLPYSFRNAFLSWCRFAFS